MFEIIAFFIILEKADERQKVEILEYLLKGIKDKLNRKNYFNLMCILGQFL